MSFILVGKGMAKNAKRWKDYPQKTGSSILSWADILL